MLEEACENVEVVAALLDKEELLDFFSLLGEPGLFLKNEVVQGSEVVAIARFRPGRYDFGGK